MNLFADYWYAIFTNIGSNNLNEYVFVKNAKLSYICNKTTIH